MATAETMTTTQAAEYLGLGSPHAARKQLHRWGVAPVSRRPGRAGESLYDAEQVRTAKAAAPGRGVGGGRPRATPADPA